MNSYFVRSSAEDSPSLIHYMIINNITYEIVKDYMSVSPSTVLFSVAMDEHTELALKLTFKVACIRMFTYNRSLMLKT